MSDKRGKMEELANQKCVACDRGAPKADDELINKFLKTSDEWDLVVENDIPKLTRNYKFTNFKMNTKDEINKKKLIKLFNEGNLEILIKEIHELTDFHLLRH